nr:helix-turn-helix domain-containing protein [bacterium]
MNQQDRILDYLRAGNTLTRLNAWSQLGVLEAPARISELRAMGHYIRTKMVTVKNRY